MERIQSHAPSVEVLLTDKEVANVLQVHRATI